MDKTLKILLIVVVIIVIISTIIFAKTLINNNNNSNLDEYTIENDIIKSVKSVVGKRTINSISTENVEGIIKQTINYKIGDKTVQEDLQQYIGYLRTDGGFKLTKDMDLSITSSSVELGKESEEDEKIIMINIDYDSFGYTISIVKMPGTIEIK